MSNPVVDKYINHYALIAVLHSTIDNLQNLIQKSPLFSLGFSVPNQYSDLFSLDYSGFQLYASI